MCMWQTGNGQFATLSTVHSLGVVCFCVPVVMCYYDVHSLGVVCFCVPVVMCYYNIHSLGVTCFCVPVVMANCYYNVLSKRHKLSTLHRQWLSSTLYKHSLKNILLTITDDVFNFFFITGHFYSCLTLTLW